MAMLRSAVEPSARETVSLGLADPGGCKLPLMNSLSTEKTEFLLVLAARIVPEIVELDSEGIGRFLNIIDEALASRPAKVRGQFATFLGILRWFPAIRFGRAFEKLDTGQQDAVLRWFEDCPVGLLRVGFWGLKAMVFMGYYGQPETNQLIGYTPEFDGRVGLHA